MMKRILLLSLMLLSTSVFAAPFLVADVCDIRANQCLYTRAPNPTATSSVVVDLVNGVVACGSRVCKIDLAAEPQTAPITLAVRESSTGLTSADVAYTYVKPTVPLPVPSGLRVVP